MSLDRIDKEKRTAHSCLAEEPIDIQDVPEHRLPEINTFQNNAKASNPIYLNSYFSS